MITTVWWNYVKQIPFSDIPLCISRTNSWNEAGLISTGQLSSLNQRFCSFVSFSAHCGKCSEGLGGSVAKCMNKNLAFLYILKHSTGLLFQLNHLHETTTSRPQLSHCKDAGICNPDLIPLRLSSVTDLIY